jgi:hypothetical protein
MLYPGESPFVPRSPGDSTHACPEPRQRAQSHSRSRATSVHRFPTTSTGTGQGPGPSRGSSTGKTVGRCRSAAASLPTGSGCTDPSGRRRSRRDSGLVIPPEWPRTVRGTIRPAHPPIATRSGGRRKGSTCRTSTPARCGARPLQRAFTSRGSGRKRGEGVNLVHFRAAIFRAPGAAKDPWPVRTLGPFAARGAAARRYHRGPNVTVSPGSRAASSTEGHTPRRQNRRDDYRD